MVDSTVFDAAFKTTIRTSPKLVIPLVNEAFGRSYAPDEPIRQLVTENEGPDGSTIADTVFRLGGRIYHIECQSTPDTDMVVRMVEYDFAIALREAIAAGAPYEMDLPESCVLFLRHNSNTPDRLEMKVSLPSGESFTYGAKVVKAQLYAMEELFDKGLLLLLPYCLMRYERALADIAADDARTNRLVAECVDLRASLEAATLAEGDALLYEELVELIIRVVDHMMAAQDALRRKVRQAMGGEVWELMTDKIARLEREAREAEEAEAQGIERTIANMEDALREHGASEELIAAAVAQARQASR